MRNNALRAKWGSHENHSARFFNFRCNPCCEAVSRIEIGILRQSSCGIGQLVRRAPPSSFALAFHRTSGCRDLDLCGGRCCEPLAHSAAGGGGGALV